MVDKKIVLIPIAYRDHKYSQTCTCSTCVQESLLTIVNELVDLEVRVTRLEEESDHM